MKLFIIPTGTLVRLVKEAAGGRGYTPSGVPAVPTLTEPGQPDPLATPRTSTGIPPRPASGPPAAPALPPRPTQTTAGISGEHEYDLGDNWKLKGADLTGVPGWMQEGWRSWLVPGLAQRGFGPRPALTDFNLGPYSPLRPTLGNWCTPMAGVSYADVVGQSGNLTQAFQAIVAAQAAAAPGYQPGVPTMPAPYTYQ